MIRKKKTVTTEDKTSGTVKNKKVVTESKSVRKKPVRKNILHKSKVNVIHEDIKYPEEINKNKSESVLKLDSILGISEINKLYKTLQDLKNVNHDILIDASGIQSVDTAVLQLLTAFCLKVNRNGNNIIWKNPTQAFIDRCCLLNLEEILKLN